METLLQDGRHGLLKLFDLLGMPVFITDGNGRVLGCNESVTGCFGYDPDEVVGRELAFFLSPAGAGGYDVPRGASCFRKGAPPFRSRVSVIPYMDSKPDLNMFVVRDAPERPTGAPGAPADTASAPAELTSELGSIINSSLSIGTIFRMVVSELRKLIDYSRASLLLYDDKEDSLRIFALDTEMKTILKKGVRAPIEGTSAGWVVRNNKPWISYDLASTAFPLDRKLLAEGIRSTISIPLFHERMLGVFNFDSTEPSKYTERDLVILLPVARHIAVALENALLF